jgi:hypothetical protein
LVVGRDRGEVELRWDDAIDDLEHRIGGLDLQVDDHQFVRHVERRLAITIAPALGFFAAAVERAELVAAVDTRLGLGGSIVALAGCERERGEQGHGEQGVRTRGHAGIIPDLGGIGEGEFSQRRARA